MSDAVEYPGDRQRRRGQSCSIWWMACKKGHADAVLAASIFHYGEYTVEQAKQLYGATRHRSETVSVKDNWLNKVNWTHDGLVPAIAQDADSGTVLMVAWMNREALKRTVERGEAVYWSRSRKKLWHKGEESGHVQKVKEIRLDCDEDVVLLKSNRLAASPVIPAAITVSSRNWKRATGWRWSRC